jgi:AcrR family transcriptional regulator
MKTEKTDRRIKYTKMALKQSLLELMVNRPIEKITVKDICEGADINRGTFYTHYSDPHDLLESIENELFNEILTSIESSLTVGVISQLLAEIFELIKKNGDLCKVLFSEFGDKEFLKKIIFIAHDRSIAEWKRHIPKADEKELELLYTFYASGSIAIIQQWIQSGMEESPETIELFIDKLTNNGLQVLK